MVGRETLMMPVVGLPAMKSVGSGSVSADSGPLAGRASGGVPGQIGVWVWPGEGCQMNFWAGRVAKVENRQRAKRRGFIGVPGRGFLRSKAESHRTGRDFVEYRKWVTGAGKGTLGEG